MKKFLSIVLVLFVSASLAYSQNKDKVVLYNGKTVSCSIKDISQDDIFVTINDKKFFRNKKIHKVNVFSYTHNNNTNILYRQDSSAGDFYSIVQMQYYIKGYSKAKENYHAPLATAGGLLTGITGGMLGFWGTAIPTGFVLSSGIKTPAYNDSIVCNKDVAYLHEYIFHTGYGLQKDKTKISDIDDDVVYFPQYQEGYRDGAKDKKIKNAMKGSIIGFIGFVVTASIISIF